MEQFTSIDEIKDLKYNNVIVNNEGQNKFTIRNSKITFSGINNILYIEPGVKLRKSKINFVGDNNIIYLSSNKHIYYLNLTLYNDSTCYIGRNNYFNGNINMILSEQTNIIIGNDGLFSFDIWMRTADPHLIYSVDTKKRINNSKSIYIGDHVWIGQHAMLLKGCKIGSGSIVGALSVLSSQVKSNCVVLGNPGKIKKEGVFWLGNSVHAWKDKETAEYESVKPSVAREYTYFKTNGSEYIASIEKNLKEIKDANKKLEFLIKNLALNDDRERFSQCSTKNRFTYNVQRIKRKVKKLLKRIIK